MSELGTKIYIFSFQKMVRRSNIAIYNKLIVVLVSDAAIAIVVPMLLRACLQHMGVCWTVGYRRFVNAACCNDRFTCSRHNTVVFI